MQGTKEKYCDVEHIGIEFVKVTVGVR